MFDLKIVNGNVFIPGSGFFDLDVATRGGRIVALGEHGTLGDAADAVDAAGKVVTPGAIDPHIHLGIFGDFTEECETETQAALAGGVTTVGVFMGGGDSYLPVLDGLIETVDARASTDLFFHLSIFSDEQMKEMEAYYERFGVTSFKFYMAGVKGVFPGVSDGFIMEGFRKVAAMGERAMACVHCEDQSMLDVAFDKLAAERPDGTLADWADAHPNYAEEEAILRANWLARQCGNRLYIVHISTREGIERFHALRKANGVAMYGETTSAYLSVTKHGDFGLLGKMLPPLRDDADREALWARVADGTLDTFGTDNVSMTRAVKGADKGMLQAMPGYPILQTHLPAILTEGYHKRGVALETLLTNATAGPARAFGLYPRKGTIAIGADADIVVLDLDAERVVRSDELYSYGDFSLFEGKTLKGWPETVVKGGRIAYRDGAITVEPGSGGYLRRTL